MRKHRIILSLFFIFMVLSCGKEEIKDEISEVATAFGTHYYNLNIKKAKEYCHPDIHGIMDFRAYNVRDMDRELHKEIDSATVKVLKYDVDPDKNSAYVDIEVKNFIRVNWMQGTIHVVPCDTFMIVLINEFNTGWVVRHPS